MRSVDFSDVEVLQRDARWDEAGDLLAAEARSLVVGVIEDRSRREYRRIMRELADRGAEGILLGCTEIDLLVGPDDSPVPVFDTTRLHAEKAVDLATR